MAKNVRLVLTPKQAFALLTVANEGMADMEVRLVDNTDDREDAIALVADGAVEDLKRAMKKSLMYAEDGSLNDPFED